MKWELCEEWALANSRECVESTGTVASTHEESEDASEARFTLKYLGSTLVETPSSEEATAEAIKTVITMPYSTIEHHSTTTNFFLYSISTSGGDHISTHLLLEMVAPHPLLAAAASAKLHPIIVDFRIKFAKEKTRDTILETFYDLELNPKNFCCPNLSLKSVR
ncbi:hypothetical protein M0804_006134 [Polistes exclamans]|nr:hypothetical protein M0804_006134 [Polistes exclamans]